MQLPKSCNSKAYSETLSNIGNLVFSEYSYWLLPKQLFLAKNSGCLTSSEYASVKGMGPYNFETYFFFRCGYRVSKRIGITPVLESLLNKAAGLISATLLKNHFTTGVSCKFWEISKNTCFTEYLWTTAYVIP